MEFTIFVQYKLKNSDAYYDMILDGNEFSMTYLLESAVSNLKEFYDITTSYRLIELVKINIYKSNRKEEKHAKKQHNSKSARPILRLSSQRLD